MIINGTFTYVARDTYHKARPHNTYVVDNLNRTFYINLVITNNPYVLSLSIACNWMTSALIF